MAISTEIDAAVADKRLADTLNEIESAGGLVTAEQEALLAGYSVAQLIRAAIALKAVRDDIELEIAPAKNRIKQAGEIMKRFDSAYDRVRETMKQKAEAEGWETSGAVDPDDLASVSIREGDECLEPIGSLDDVAELYIKYTKSLDEEAVWETIRSTKEVPAGIRVVKPKWAQINLRKRGKALAAVLGIRGMLNGANRAELK